MEKLSKFAIYLAIGIGIVIFSLFLYSILPHIIENSGRDWDRATKSGMLSEEILQLFKEEPAYIAMLDKYPDAKEEFKFNKPQRSELQVGVYNTENDNQLVLKIWYDYNQNISTYLECIPGNGDDRLKISGLFVINYIQNNTCLTD